MFRSAPTSGRASGSKPRASGTINLMLERDTDDQLADYFGSGQRHAMGEIFGLNGKPLMTIFEIALRNNSLLSSCPQQRYLKVRLNRKLQVCL